MFWVSLGSFVFTSHEVDTRSMPGRVCNRCMASCVVLPFMRSFICSWAWLLSAYTHTPLQVNVMVGREAVTVAVLVVTWTSPSRLYPVPSFLRAWVVRSCVAFVSSSWVL